MCSAPQLRFVAPLSFSNLGLKATTHQFRTNLERFLLDFRSFAIGSLLRLLVASFVLENVRSEVIASESADGCNELRHFTDLRCTAYRKVHVRGSHNTRQLAKDNCLIPLRHRKQDQNCFIYLGPNFRTPYQWLLKTKNCPNSKVYHDYLWENYSLFCFHRCTDIKKLVEKNYLCVCWIDCEVDNDCLILLL